MAYRSTTRGRLDGKTFHGARELGELVGQRPAHSPMPRKASSIAMPRHGSRHPTSEIVLDQIGQAFADANYAFQPLVLALVGNRALRYLKSEAP